MTMLEVLKFLSSVRLPNRKSSAVVRLSNPKFSSVVGLPNPKMNTVVRLPNPKLTVGLRPACRADVCARSSDTHATHNWNDFGKSKLDKRKILDTMIMVNWT